MACSPRPSAASIMSRRASSESARQTPEPVRPARPAPNSRRRDSSRSARETKGPLASHIATILLCKLPDRLGECCCTGYTLDLLQMIRIVKRRQQDPAFEAEISEERGGSLRSEVGIGGDAGDILHKARRGASQLLLQICL